MFLDLTRGMYIYKLILSSVSMALIAVLIGCATTTPKPQAIDEDIMDSATYIELANKAFIEKRYGDVLKYASNVIQVDRDNQTGQFMRGVALAKLGNGREARKALVYAKNINPISNDGLKAGKWLNKLETPVKVAVYSARSDQSLAGQRSEIGKFYDDTLIANLRKSELYDLREIVNVHYHLDGYCNEARSRGLVVLIISNIDRYNLVHSRNRSPLLLFLGPLSNVIIDGELTVSIEVVSVRNCSVVSQFQKSVAVEGQVGLKPAMFGLVDKIIVQVMPLIHDTIL